MDGRLWGKAEGLERPYPLIGHLVDTAMIAGVLWDGILGSEQRGRIAAALGMTLDQARKVIMFWAGLHDIAKIMPGFQDKAGTDHPLHCTFLREPRYAHDRSRDSSVRPAQHDYGASRAVPGLLGELGYPTDGMAAFQLRCQVGEVLGGHHGRYPVGLEEHELRRANGGLVELGHGGWAEERSAHAETLHELLGRPATPKVEAMPVACAVVVAGLVIVADWLASQESVVEARLQQWFDHCEPGSPEALHNHAQVAQVEAPAVVGQAGLGNAGVRVREFAEQFPEISDPHPLQRSIEQGLASGIDGPGILLVTAPTGEGKTEAALHATGVLSAAAGGNGLFFALPTQATANQMFGRIVRFAQRNLLDPGQVTLVHGAADLFEGYQPDVASRAAAADAPEDRVLSHGPADAEGVSAEASRWLRGRGRGLLAGVSVGTVDQALMGVLPLKRNALRHVGLAGKTVVIDEAHSYDAFTHALLLRLLNWLGAMGVPVVLLSATLTGDTARGLLRSYLTGAGHPGRELPSPGYPGWLYACGRTGRVSGPDEPVGTSRSRVLTVDVRRVEHTYDGDVAGGRLALLLEELTPVVAEGGCAAVICTTVGEAQATYSALRDHLTSLHGPDYAGWDDRRIGSGPRPGGATLLRLLHARFPANRRAKLTAEAEKWFGRVDGEGTERPPTGQGAILVATQIIEQSLDLDFDLVVSDLAPMAQLLQRAGRGWRHAATPRPPWATGPRLVVLAPRNENGVCPPKTWGDVYSTSLLVRTEQLLRERPGAKVAIPEDVQALVDGVYDEEFRADDPEALLRHDIERMGDELARQGLAGLVMLPAPDDVMSLHTLTSSDADPALIATRLGAETVQLLPVYVDDEGGRWLDEECTHRLPLRGRRTDGRFTRAELRDVLGHVVPYRYGPWFRSLTAANERPAGWAKEPRLADLVLLPHRVAEGSATGTELGEVVMGVDHALGLLLSPIN